MVKNRKDAAFTMVELLVVVAVLALLLALLIPALEKAREHARLAKCLAGQRQLLTAMNAYTMDTQRLMAAGHAIADPSIGHGYSLRWLWYQRSGLGQYFNESLPRNIDSGLPNNSLMRCPSKPKFSSNAARSYQTYTVKMAFDYNSRFGTGGSLGTKVLKPYWLSPRTSQIMPRPAQYVLFHDGRGATSLYVSDFRFGQSVATSPSRPDYRHYGGANYGFLDGHAVHVADPNTAHRVKRELLNEPW